MLERKRPLFHEAVHAVVPVLPVTALLLLLVLAGRDLGTALVLMGLVGALMFAAGVPLRVFATAGLIVAILAVAAWLPFLIDWIFNGDSTGHIQSLILGAVLFIAAIQLFALGVIGDLPAGQRVMTQRVFERVRRVELALEVEPSHYERGEPDKAKTDA